jgi:muconolactone delta-isomerase
MAAGTRATQLSRHRVGAPIGVCDRLRDTSPVSREVLMLFLVISNPQPDAPSSVVGARQRYWEWVRPLQASGEIRFVYARVGRDVVVLFDVPSNEVLHRRLNEWQDIIPVQFDTYPLIDPEAAQQFLLKG